MTRTITGNYDDPLKVRNAQDDLISSGIDQEKVFADEANGSIKVMVPAAIEREIVEIIKRHGPNLVEIH